MIEDDETFEVDAMRRVQRSALAGVLKTLDIAHEMSVPLLDTTVYRLASEHVCRNSCVVPAAILKALEVEAGIFQAAESQIEFVGSVQQ